MNNEQKKAVGIGVGAFVAAAWWHARGSCRRRCSLGGAGALAHRFRGREREWHDVPPPPA